MYCKALIAVLALSAGSLSQQVAAQKLQCGDITDLLSYCKNDCGDTEYKSSECGAYGPDCYCINQNGEIENTNINAPILCEGSNVETTCAKECGKVQNIEDFSCENEKIDCVCAADDGIEGLGDDISQDLADYADANDSESIAVAEEMANSPPSSPIVVPDIVNSDVSDIANSNVDVSPPTSPDAVAPAVGSGIQTTVGSFVLATAFGLVFA